MHVAAYRVAHCNWHTWVSTVINQNIGQLRQNEKVRWFFAPIINSVIKFGRNNRSHSREIAFWTERPCSAHRKFSYIFLGIRLLREVAHCGSCVLLFGSNSTQMYFVHTDTQLHSLVLCGSRILFILNGKGKKFQNYTKRILKMGWNDAVMQQMWNELQARIFRRVWWALKQWNDHQEASFWTDGDHIALW